MINLLSEVRLAARALVRSPVYVTTAVVTLALGVGALSLSLAFANAFFFRPMPFRADHELVGISMTHRVASGEILDYAVSINDYLALRERNRSFTDIGVINQQTYTLLVGETPESVRGGRVSASIWSVLGTSPISGRVFDSSEDRPDASIVVISAGLQQRLFPAGASDAIGRSIVVDGRARTVIGVMPRGFRPRMNPGDVWIPLGASTSSPQPDARGLQTVARRLPGVTLAAAAADVSQIARDLEAERPVTNKEWGASTKDLRAKVADRARGITIALVGAVLFMLILTCANAANLAIARVVRRRADIATRLALGAAPSSIARQYIIEALLVSAAGGLLGGLLAAGALPLTRRVLTSDNPLLSLVGLDWRVFLAVVAVSILAGLVASAAPALLSMRLVALEAVGSSAKRSYATAKDRRLRNALMSAQVAAAAVLLTGSIGAILSLRELLQTDVGYDPSNVMLATVTLPTARYPGVPERGAFVSQVQERLASSTGVANAGATTGQFIRDARVQAMFLVVGEAVGTEATLAAEVRRVTPQYFETLSIPILKGRQFGAADRDSAPPVAIVNQSFANKYLAGRDALVTRIKRNNFPPVDIVGVVPDSRDGGASEDPGPTVYLPFGQSSAARVTFVIETAVSSREAEGILRSAVKSVDPGLPVDRVAAMRDMLRESLGEERFRTVVLGGMTALAVLIACVGIYGVTVYLVQASARDVAIRLALGAPRDRVVGQLLGTTLKWIAGGTVAGIVISFIGGAQFARRFPELAPASVTVYFVVASVLVIMGITASAVPSLRASRMPPSRVLRGD